MDRYPPHPPFSFWKPWWPISSPALPWRIPSLADTASCCRHRPKSFWAVGFGGFSTFSTFSGRPCPWHQSGFTGSSMAYVLASLLACIAAILLGLLPWPRYLIPCPGFCLKSYRKTRKTYTLCKYLRNCCKLLCYNKL